jgi:hypothetical protein
MIPHAMKMLCISLVVGSFVAGCVGSGSGKSRAYTVNGVAAGTTIAGMVIASQVMKADESGDQIDMGPTLAYVWGGLTLATLAALSVITLQMPESENFQREEAGVARLELIPTPRSIHID